MMDKSEGIEEKLSAMADEEFRLPEAPEAFRDALFNMTAAKVKARPRRRRLLMAAALVLAFLSGMAVMLVIPDRSGDHTETVAARPGPEKKEESPSPAAASGKGFNAEAMARRIAEAPAPEKVRLLRETGDYYMSYGDYQRAARCYGRMLDLMDDTRYRADDNWLLARMKEARMKETNHET